MNELTARLKAYFSANRHIVLAVALLVLLRTPSLFESFWYGDEGIYAAIADGLHQGKTLYAQVWDHKPPLLYWLYYLAGIGGNWDIGIVIIKSLGIAASVASLYLLRPILNIVFSSKLAQVLPLYAAAILLGLPHLEPNTANAEVFFIPVNLAILWLMLKRQRPVVIGILLGVSLLIKFHSFFEASLVISFISLLQQYKHQQSWRDWFNRMLRVAAGLAIVAIPYLVYTFIQGNTADMLNAALWYNLGYTEDAQSTLQLFGLGLSLSKLLLVAVVGLLAIVYYLYRQAYLGLSLGVIAVVALSEYVAAIVSGRPYAHYALQVIPGVTLILGYALQWQVSLKDSWRKLLPLPIALIVLIIMWFGFTRGQSLASLVTPQSYYPAFIQSFITRSHPEAFAWRYGYNIPRYAQLAQHINKNYQQQQTYYFYGNSPWLFTQIDKDFTNTYLFWFHVSQNPTKDTQDRLDAELLIVDPTVHNADKIISTPENFWQKQETYNGFDIYVKN